MHAARPGHFSRYVALGDSSTEGLDDPDGAGGYRGWSQRLAERMIAAWHGVSRYAHDSGMTLRAAATTLAVQRVTEAHRLRGLYP